MQGIDQNIRQMRLSLRPELVLKQPGKGKQNLYGIEDPVTGRLYEVGEKEFALLKSLDSSESVEQRIAFWFPQPDDPQPEGILSPGPSTGPASTGPASTGQAISGQASSATNIPGQSDQQPQTHLGFDQSQVMQVISWALQKGLLKDAGESLKQYQRKNAIQAKVGHFSRWLNWISFQVPFGCPEKLFQKVSPALTWFFSPWFAVLWVGITFWAVFEFYFQCTRFWDQSDQVISNGAWIQLLVVWAGVKVFHELAHGVAAHKYGSHVRGCGVMFILFMPMAFVDITSSAKLRSRWQRIVIAGAGMYFECFLASIAMILWATTESVVISQWSYALIVSAGLSTVLFNANPLMKFDGYFILSDILGETNLAENGKNWVRSVFRRWVLGVPYSHHQSAGGWIIGTYGVLATIWRILLNLTLLISATAIFYGFGAIVAFGALFAMYLVPAFTKSVQVFQKKSWEQWNLVNLGLSSVVGASLLFFVFKVFSGPATIDSPAVVRYHKSSIVRCQSEGFLDQWSVQPGQWVEKGQPIASLKNIALSSHLKQLSLELQQKQVEAKILLHTNQLGQWKVLKKEVEKLNAEIDHHKRKVANLTVRALASGQIPDIPLNNFLGRYYREGDKVLELLGQAKEVAISISQDDLPSLNQQVGQPVKLLFAGHKKIAATLASVQPRASDQLLSDSLSSVNGGPLSVKMASDDPNDGFKNPQKEMVLVVPRITAIVNIDRSDAKRLPLGQRGVVYFRSQKQSLGSYLYLSFRRWIQKKIDQSGL